MSNFTSSKWCGINWCDWVPFVDGDFKTISDQPGLYRVRVIEQPLAAYIGQTGRNLRERVTGLRRHTLAQNMPFNDPHTAAPSLWAWCHAEGYNYECSVAPTGATRRDRLAMECWLLWKYRTESGGSALCNHGHFHPGYVKSKNRSTSVRGGPRSQEEQTARGLSSHPPLVLSASPTDSAWMGLEWSGWASLSSIPGGAFPALYRIIDAKSQRLLYIGETQNLGQRMRSHAQKRWSGSAPMVSSCRLPEATSKVHLHELENDLIGGYYEQMRTSPELQFMNGD
jgi:hypothetical protein